MQKYSDSVFCEEYGAQSVTCTQEFVQMRRAIHADVCPLMSGSSRSPLETLFREYARVLL